MHQFTKAVMVSQDIDAKFQLISTQSSCLPACLGYGWVTSAVDKTNVLDCPVKFGFLFVPLQSAVQIRKADHRHRKQPVGIWIIQLCMFPNSAIDAYE